SGDALATIRTDLPAGASALPGVPGPFASAAELEQFLLEDAGKRYQSLFGARFPAVQPPVGERGGTVPPLRPSIYAAGAGSSSTNLQVPGVDEADLVKNDGDYVYVLTDPSPLRSPCVTCFIAAPVSGAYPSDSTLVILSARPADKPSVASRTQIEGQAIAEYLRGERLTVISQVYAPIDPDPAAALRTYFSGKLKVTVFDV